MRIGSGNNRGTSRHRICSKTTDGTDKTSTTTKITIDLSARGDETFKAPSLILKTFGRNEPDVPQQLEVLKRLYEDWQSDSDADREVQSFMSSSSQSLAKRSDDENYSVISGSWSKMRTLKQLQAKKSESPRFDHAHVGKGTLESNNQTKQNPPSPVTSLSSLSRVFHVSTYYSTHVSANLHQDESYNNNAASSKNISLSSLDHQELANKQTDRHSYRRSTESSLAHQRSEAKHSVSSSQKNARTRNNVPRVEQETIKKATCIRPDLPRNEPRYRSLRAESGRTKEAETYSTLSEDNIIGNARQKSPGRSVLRNPRKSELAYFGVKVSPTPPAPRKSAGRDDNPKAWKSDPKLLDRDFKRSSHDAKLWNDKPDLLQHHEVKRYDSRRKALRGRSKSPIYENIDEFQSRKQFDSSILDELARTADQILQSVHADEQQRINSADADSCLVRERLDTIVESKSWQRDRVVTPKTGSNRTRSSLKHASSNSSVESAAGKVHSVPRPSAASETGFGAGQRQSRTVHRAVQEKVTKKTAVGEATSSRSVVKARRLQRASSREALLQSHGSSSEDLQSKVEVPLRKPRMVRKSKTTPHHPAVDAVKQVSSSRSSNRDNSKGRGQDR